MRPLTLAILAALLPLAAAAEPKTPNLPVSGLEKLLGPIAPGMAFADFLKIHPEAEYSDPAKMEEEVTPEQPGGLLVLFKEDPFLGLECMADFGFKDGKLYEYVVTWRGTPKKTGGERETFFGTLTARHGKDYRREALRVHPGSESEALIPVMCWETGSERILAYHTPPLKSAPREQGSFTYACFQKADESVLELLAGGSATPEQLSDAWKAMEPFTGR